MKIGFLGGTGIEAKGLALRFGAAGFHVMLGSRDRERAESAAAACNEIIGSSNIRGATNEEALADTDLVFLTVPFEKALTVIQTHQVDLRPGQVIIDVTVPMTFAGGRAEYLEQGSRSNSEILAEELPPGVELVGASKTIPARILADIRQTPECDVFVCGDSQNAKAKVIEAANLSPGVRPVDAGPRANARILERMTVLAVHLNRRYKSNGARFRVVGI